MGIESNANAHIKAAVNKEANAYCLKHSNPYTTKGLECKNQYIEIALPYAIQIHALDAYMQKVANENKQLHELVTKLFEQIQSLTKELNDSIQTIEQSNNIIKKLLEDGDKQ